MVDIWMRKIGAIKPNWQVLDKTKEKPPLRISICSDVPENGQSLSHLSTKKPITK